MENERLIVQNLGWGDIAQERLSPANTMFAIAGHRIYVIGDIDGQFRPRSNPYDLYAFGKPDPNDPLAEKLQGVWAQPVKGISRYGYSVEMDGEIWRLEDAERFTQCFSHVELEFQRGPLTARRLDFVAQDLPVLITELTLRNNGAQPLDLRVAFEVTFELVDAWFTSLADRRNTGERVTLEDGRLVARAEVLPERWGAAAGGAAPAQSEDLLDGSTGKLGYLQRLGPGEEQTLVFGMAVESKGGPVQALKTLHKALGQYEQMLAEKQALYTRIFTRGPRLKTPDPLINAAFDLARANLHLLEAEQPEIGRYFYAGLEMFPFWFSNDGAYSAPGLLAAGLRDSTLNHIRIGLAHVQDGRVPHQISPAGHIAFAGNAQETPLWVMSIWDAYRWTGDREFLAALYPGAWKGMFDYVLGAIDPDGDGYPSGPGMVEVEGMGAEKLDSAAYTWAALHALAAMAETLGKPAEAYTARRRAQAIAARFDVDWWDEQGGTYAMSLTEANTRYPVPHWAVIVPLEVGLATPEHAAQTFASLQAGYLNRWGIKHTLGDDERVWTLPTATLSRAAYRYGERELGFAMLRHTVETLETGSIGLFHELIPEGACFIQLWSAATFLRGVIEDLLGLEVHAAEHHLKITPQLPAGWDAVALENLSFGAHRVSLRFAKDRVEVTHEAGPEPLSVQMGKKTVSLAAGQFGEIMINKIE